MQYKIKSRRKSFHFFFCRDFYFAKYLKQYTLNYCLTYKNMFFPIFFTCVRIHWISKAIKIAANKYRIFVCSTSFGI